MEERVSRMSKILEHMVCKELGRDIFLGDYKRLVDIYSNGVVKWVSER